MVFFSVMNDAIPVCSDGREFDVAGSKGSSGSAGVDLAEAFSRVGGRRASGGSSGRGVVGAGDMGMCSYIVDLGVVVRESVDFLDF